MKKPHPDQKNTIQLALIGGVLFLFVISIGLTLRLSGQVDDLQREAKEAAKPAELQITRLLAGSCVACDAQVTEMVSQIHENADITSENTILLNNDALAAQSYIKEYGIERLPAVIISGEIEKASLSGFEKRNDALVFEVNTPPYSTTAGETIGLVGVSLFIDESCEECADARSIVTGLEQAGVVVGTVDEIASQSTAGKQLASLHSLTRAPTVIFSRDLSAYPEVAGGISQLGREGSDGSYILETGLTPFKDLNDGEIKGFVDVVFLDDSSCEECYDVQLHKQVLARLGLVLGEEKTIDISENAGKILIDEYEITQVPTIILSEDAGYYPALSQAWSGVGSIEDDGVFIFRKIDAMGNYKNLETNEVITK